MIPSYCYKKDKRITVLIVLLIVLLISNAITLKLFLDEKYSATVEDYEQAWENELENVRYFICDWYAEISLITSDVNVYKNEIQFGNGKYILTVSQNRIRAVFPRGERFFRFNTITYVEFYTENNRHLCRLFYGKGGEFVFRIV